MLFDDVTKRWTLTTANRLLRNCQEDIRFCYDIRGKSYYKYDPKRTSIEIIHMKLSKLVGLNKLRKIIIFTVN